MTHATPNPAPSTVPGTTTGTTTGIAGLVLESYLAPYTGNTRTLYARHVGDWFTWCTTNGLDPLTATRLHLELYYRHRIEDRRNSPATIANIASALKGYYRIAVGDDLLTKNPVDYARRPRPQTDPTARVWLSRIELQRLLLAARQLTPRHNAAAHLLGVLGLRVSEACSIQIEDYRGELGGHQVLRLVGKGHKPAQIPLPVPVLRALDSARGVRVTGPLLTTHDGQRGLTRHGATSLIATVCRHAHLPVVTPHVLRRSAITAALDSGVPLRDAQHFARHADPKTTSRYDRGQASLDRHAVHVISAVVA